MTFHILCTARRGVGVGVMKLPLKIGAGCLEINFLKCKINVKNSIVSFVRIFHLIE